MIHKFKQLISQPGFKKYLKNSSLLLLERGVRMIAALTVGVWVTRHLGPADFGIFSYATAIIGLFSVFANIGLESILVVELIKNKYKHNKLIGTAFFLKTFSAVLAILMIFSLTYYLDKSALTTKLVLIVSGIILFQSFNVVILYFQSKVLSQFVVYVNLTVIIITNLIRIVLIISDAPVLYFAWAYFFEVVFLAIGYIYIYGQQKLSIFTWSFDTKIAIYFFYQCWPLFISEFLISAYMRIDQIMIEEMLGTASVGQYAAALRLSEVWYFIPIVITASFLPAIVNVKENVELYIKRFQSLYDLMFWMAVSISIPTMFFADQLIETLYGQVFNETALVLVIHIWSSVFVFIGLVCSKFLICENMAKTDLYKSLLGVISNIIANYILIPKYGVAGAAYATLISLFFAHILYDLFDRNLRPQFRMKMKSIFPVHVIAGIIRS